MLLLHFFHWSNLGTIQITKRFYTRWLYFCLLMSYLQVTYCVLSILFFWVSLIHFTVADYTFPFLTVWPHYIHTLSFSVVTSSSATKIFISYKLWCAALPTSIWIQITNFSKSVFSVAISQRMNRRHWEQCALKAKEAENDPDCRNNWQCDSDSSPAQIGWTDISFFKLELGVEGPLIQWDYSICWYVFFGDDKWCLLEVSCRYGHQPCRGIHFEFG